MTKIAIYNMAGKSTTRKEIKSDLFDMVLNPNVVTQAINAQLANRRNVIANTKTRGKVSGGGKKPFKQKGTGNARAGSSRSPLWIGGGITFGPTKFKNYEKRIPKKINTSAIKMLIAQKITDKRFILLSDFKLEKISTKQVYNVFSKLPIEEGKILVILPELNANLELSMANIPYAHIVKSGNLNAYDIARHDYIVITVNGLDKISEFLK